MDLLHIDDPGRYLRRLRGDVVELERLREDLLSGVSVFFRDPEAFRILDAEALQPLLEANASGMPIRIWVPGCATGEEAYGIAMLLESQLENRGGSRDGVRVYATDIDDAALRQARRGEYSVAALRNVSLGWRRRFFDAIDERTYRVKESLRDRVLFASHNLLTDSPFSRLDLICCRNLLDLFDAPVRDYLLERLHAALNPGGWLLLGSDDTPVVGIGLFEPVAKRWRLYRRVAADGASVAAGPGPQPERALAGRAGQGAARALAVEARARQLLQDAFVPTSALIDRSGQLLHLHGAAGRYLRLPQGVPTRALWAMARDGLADALRAAVTRALRTGEIATVEAALGKDGDADSPSDTPGVQPPEGSRPKTSPEDARRGDDERAWVRTEVRPLRDRDGGEGLLLVSFHDLPASGASRAAGSAEAGAADVPPAVAGGTDARELAALRYELTATRADLSQTIQALERANAELQAYNDELMSSNEELRAANSELELAKRELEQRNEEADRANAKLAAEVTAVQRANDDINNLLSCTQMATIFVDTDNRIKLFTAAATRLIHLRGGDVGRPLSELAQVVPDPDLITDCQAVLRDGKPLERELIAADGACFLRRSQPYVTHEGAVTGCVVGYVDITDRASHERLLRERELHYRMLFDNSPICLLEQDWSELQPLLDDWRKQLSLGPELLDGDEDVLAVCRRRVRLTAVNAAGRQLLELDDKAGEPGDGLLPSTRSQTFGTVLKLFAEGRMAADCEDELVTSRGNHLPVLCHFVRLPEAMQPDRRGADPGGRHKALGRVLVAVYDIRERKALQSAVVASEQRLRRALHVVHEGVWDYDVRNGHLWWSAEYARMWGAPPPTATTTYDWLLDRIHPEDRVQVQDSIRAAIDGDGDLWQAEYRCMRADGSYANVLDRGAITRDDQGQVVRMLGCMLDITDLKQAQQELRKREQRLRSVLDAAADAIITVNSKARILSFNPAAEAMFCRESREIMGQGVGQLFGTVGGRLLTRELAAGHPTEVWAKEIGARLMEGLRGDDELFPVEVSVRPVEGSGLFVILARDLSEQRRLEREIIEMSTRQQQEIGREIHDGLGQELTALLMLASGLERKLSRPDGGLGPEDFAKITQYLKRALDTARSLSKGLAPADIATEGLPAALQDLADRMQAATGLDIDFSSAGDVRVDDSNRAAHLFRIAQEALSNAVRHADATRLELGLEATDDGLLLSIRDNGKGLPEDAERNGRLGLHLMRYRASILGGECSIAAHPGGGTLVRCEVPMRAAGSPS